MTNFVFEVLKESLKSNTIKMVLPFLSCVVFFGIVILIIQRVKKSKIRALDLGIAFLTTVIAYFTFIFVNDFKRLDYFFDIFKYLEGTLKETAVVFRGLNIFTSSSISALRIATNEIYEARRRSFINLRLTITYLLSSSILVAKEMKLVFNSLVKDLKEVFIHKSNILQTELCVFRC